jgi:AraC-like DNA-binding protein
MSRLKAIIRMPPFDSVISPRPLLETVAEGRAAPLLLGELTIMASRDAAAADAHVVAVDGRYALTIPLTNGGHVQVVVPVQTMERALAALSSVPRTTPLRFDLAGDIGSGPGAGIVRLLELIVAEADAEGVLQAPAVASRLADALVNALLLGLPHNYAHLLGRTAVLDGTPAPELEPRYVRRVEQYIAANAHCPISIADLAAVAGVGERTLFSAFRAHRGQSPMALLRAHRFDLARAKLLSSMAPSVGEVAFSCGFEHLGRFSTGYRQRFGETPTQAQRRARSKSA